MTMKEKVMDERMKNDTYELIKNALTRVATSRKMLMDEGEDKCEIDNLISEFGAKEVERLEQMTHEELLMEMVQQLIRLREDE